MSGTRSQQLTLTWSKPRQFDGQTRRLLTAAQSQVTVVLENQRLLATMRQTTEQLSNQVRIQQALNELSHTINQVDDEKTLFNQTCESLVKAFDIDHAGLTIINPDGGTATVVAEYPDMKAVGVVLEADNDIWVEIREKRQPIIINDVDNNPRLHISSRQSLQNIGVKSLLILPLIGSNQELLGTVGLDLYNLDKQFHQEQVEVAGLFMTQVSLSLQKIRLLRNSQERAEQMRRIAEYGQQVQSHLELSDVFKTALEQSHQVIQHDFMQIVLYDSDKDVLLAVATHFRGRNIINLRGINTIGRVNTPVGKVWRERKLYYNGALSEEPDTEHPLTGELNTLMMLPLIVRGRSRGVLEIGSKRQDAYNETDQSVIQQLGNQVAIAVENADAYAQSQRLARNKSLANEIATQLQQQTDIDGLLNVTIHELGKALGAKRARIRLGRSNTTNGNHAQEQD